MYVSAPTALFTGILKFRHQYLHESISYPRSSTTGALPEMKKDNTRLLFHLLEEPALCITHPSHQLGRFVRLLIHIPNPLNLFKAKGLAGAYPCYNQTKVHYTLDGSPLYHRVTEQQTNTHNHS